MKLLNKRFFYVAALASSIYCSQAMEDREKEKKPDSETKKTETTAPTAKKSRDINFDDIRINPNAGSNKKNKNKGGQGDKG